ncbi:MAG: leucine-rich repeat protein [Oscillospiraceae bacterium]|nr:leucine-rich repeat protein [Oscillospiraceae bacterium]
MSFDDGFMMGLMLGNEGGGGGGDDDDWTPPEFPEPGAYQITILIDLYLSEKRNSGLSGNKTITLTLTDKNNMWATSGESRIDWGDGTITSFVSGYSLSYSHEYKKAERYVITVTGKENENYIYFSSTYGKDAILGIKFGSKMGINGIFYNMNDILYVKFCGETFSTDGLYFGDLYTLTKVEFAGGYPHDGDFRTNCFRGCRSLKKADFTKKLSVFPNTMFSECFSLKEVDTSSAVTFEGSVFSNCYNLKEINAPLLENMNGGSNIQNCYILRKFSAPKLKEISAEILSCYSISEIDTPSLISAGPQSFYCCYNLQKLICAEGCDFNGNPFFTCPQLYPRPQ